MTARKLFILLVTVAIVLALYLVYTIFNNAPVLVVDRGSGRVAETNAPDVNSTMGKIGATRIGTVVKAVYTELDEDKNVKREFGFEKLLHESGNEWTLEKPYMNIIEKDFVCGITADTGKVQVEMAAGKPAPKDAQLSGNVVIHILPDKGAKMSESFAYLDDISYVSEKSLFTTAGPVRFVSDDAELAGKGLEVIYSTGSARLELMQLAHLEFLKVKTFKESLFAKSGARDEVKEEKASVSGSGKSTQQYYRCVLSKNVVIQYGSQATILAPDEFSISNMFWPKSRESSGKRDSAAAVGSPSSAKDANSHSSTDNSAEEIIPILVTCENGIIVRPMEETASPANAADVPQRMLELSGTPVVIKTSDVAGAQMTASGASGKQVLAECGWLKCNLDLGVLDMFSRPRQYVSLNLEQDGSKLETTDSLSWFIKDRRAIVHGPGTLYLPEKRTEGSKQKEDAARASMNFGGTMNVLFAGEPGQNSLQQPLDLKSIDLAGGFTASMQNNSSHLAADSAKLLFGTGNAISEANLDGNVRLSSDAGSLRTQKAKVLFAGDNVVSQADLDGNVNFDSKTGSLKSQQAKVLFTKDSQGNVYASVVQSFGNVEIFPAKTAGQKAQSVFRAQRIDYDIPKGYAVANGQVELAVRDANGVPLTITAKQKAEYFSKSDEVVFQGGVDGRMIKQSSNEYSEFRGDKLTAKLGRSNQDKDEPNAAQGTGIERLSITGDVVRFESYQKQQDKVIGGIKLKCRQVDYDGLKNAVLASGGKDCFAYIDNSNAPKVEKGGSGFNPKGPCVVYLEDFDNLQWYMGDNRVVADGIPSGMHIIYLPGEGKDGQKVQIDAGRVQIDLTQMPTGQKEISTLNAAGGIHYLEEGKYEIYGNELFYDGSRRLIRIARDSSKPCIINGAIVDGVVINLTDNSMQVIGPHVNSSVPIPVKQAK